ncbi:MAG: hypothetical protein M1820_007663 [Bogoriella megaspora]|nr:MAG: hypothetical protein M1820_007663 [Bogoriella megaspora]
MNELNSSPVPAALTREGAPPRPPSQPKCPDTEAFGGVPNNVGRGEDQHNVFASTQANKVYLNLCADVRKDKDTTLDQTVHQYGTKKDKPPG